MNASDLLRDLYRHMEWADALVWSTVLSRASLVEDTTLRERLHHIHMVQRAFLHIWRKEPFALEGSDALRGADLARWGRGYHAEVPRFLGTLNDVALEGVVELPWAAHVAEKLGTPFLPPRLGETVMQVTSHSTHHRGQVATRLRELGAEPPLTDYIAWAWSGRPAPGWPAGME